jgi:hypothetical protein
MASPTPKNTFLGTGDSPCKQSHAKKIITFYMILVEVKLYIKIVEIDEAYNFVVDNFFV